MIIITIVTKPLVCLSFSPRHQLLPLPLGLGLASTPQMILHYSESEANSLLSLFANVQHSLAPPPTPPVRRVPFQPSREILVPIIRFAGFGTLFVNSGFITPLLAFWQLILGRNGLNCIFLDHASGQQPWCNVWPNTSRVGVGMLRCQTCVVR
ncbi:hypothetical protein DFH07DRAFT_781204 [Mycena maculata]|uniref:Uncharacterized protein n=1 Tax=Mycena maculata TaxID=230809 RepID=A0AAD7HZD3_9AGAR|nr:hypothetical protein DFH07DRAFT_781204 [Mycena maculata]